MRNINENNAISGVTPDILSETEKISRLIAQDDSLLDWDIFLENCNNLANTPANQQAEKIGHLMTEAKFVPHYRYLVYYMVAQYAEELSEKSGRDLLSRNKEIRQKSRSELAEEICMEIAEGVSQKKQWQGFLTDLIVDEMRQSGFEAEQDENGKTKKVYSSLWNTKDVWTVKALSKVVFADKITEEDFLTLAVGMNMNVWFINDFLNRVLLREELNYWNIREVIVYLCCQDNCVKDNKHTFCGDVLKLYEETEAKEREFKTEYQNRQTDIVYNAAAELVEKMKFNILISDSDEVTEFLAEHKYLCEERLRLVQVDRERKKSYRKVNREERDLYAEDVEAREHLRTADKLFLEQIDKIGQEVKYRKKLYDEKVKKPVREDENKKSAGIICDFLYRFDYQNEMDDNRSYERLAEQLKAVIYGEHLRNPRISKIRNGNDHVRRNEFLTAAFLAWAIDREKTAYIGQCNGTRGEEYLMAFVEEFRYQIDDLMEEAGFHGLYLTNAYDCFLMYLAMTDTPFTSYQYLWSICNAIWRNA